MILKHALWIRIQIYYLPLNCYLYPVYIVGYYEHDSKTVEMFSNYTNVCAQQPCIQFIHLLYLAEPRNAHLNNRNLHSSVDTWHTQQQHQHAKSIIRCFFEICSSFFYTLLVLIFHVYILKTVYTATSTNYFTNQCFKNCIYSCILSIHQFDVFYLPNNLSQPTTHK